MCLMQSTVSRFVTVMTSLLPSQKAITQVVAVTFLIKALLSLYWYSRRTDGQVAMARIETDAHGVYDLEHWSSVRTRTEGIELVGTPITSMLY